MKLPDAVSRFDEVSLGERPLFLAIGMFDGVHLGHQAVIASAVNSAARVDGVAGVLTFHPHPSRLFRPENPTRLIMPPEFKTRRLLAMGAALVINKPFDTEYAAVEAGDFLAHLKAHLPTLAAVHVGENFRFGKGRKGDIQLLVESGRQEGVGVFSAQRLRWNGEPISSTRIRECLAVGRMEEANALLGYCYFSEGEVIPGDARGRGLGYPTLNFAWDPELRPRYGVYAVTVRSERDGKALPGAANYGLRPTFGETEEPRLEVHALAPTGLGPGDTARVGWHGFVRDERKFQTPDDLREQIARDVEAVQAALG